MTRLLLAAAAAGVLIGLRLAAAFHRCPVPVDDELPDRWGD